MSMIKVEENIDIEEHDVLDNPRVQHLVPDLSCVKHEAPDEENQASDRLLCNGAPEASPAPPMCKKTAVFELMQASLGVSDHGNHNLHTSIRPKAVKRRCKALKSAPKSRFLLDQNRIESEPVQPVKEEVLTPEIPATKTRCPKILGSQVQGPKNPASKVVSPKILGPKNSGAENQCPKNYGAKDQSSKKAGSKIGDPEITEPTPVFIQSIKKENQDFDKPDYKTGDPEISVLREPDSVDEKSNLTDADYFNTIVDVKSEFISNSSKGTVNEAVTDIDVNEMRKILSASVRLKDCGPGLNDSSRFCKECGTLFSASEYLLAHNETSHAKIDAAEMQKIKSAFVYLEDVGNLLKTAKNYRRIKNELLTYHCMVCNDVIQGYKSAKIHRVIKHPNSIDTRIFNRIITRKDNLAFNNQNLPTPTSVLFQCSKCSVHFVSYTAANLHSELCQNETIGWECHVCKRSFISGDKNKHLMQHEMNPKPFNVYVTGDDILGKILNECPNCKTLLHESSFARHISTACKGESVTCTICKLNVHSSSIEEHYKWHYKTNLSDKKEFIIIEYAISANSKETSSNDVSIKPVKRKIEDAKEDTRKKWKRFDINAAPVKVYYCVTCGCYSVGCVRSNHTEGRCQNKVTKKRLICKICGLTSSSCGMHRSFHESNPNATIMDMQFLRADTDELITPPMPRFRECSKCNVQYCRKAHERRHRCEDSYKSCKICSKLFSEVAYRLHLPFHEYADKMKQSQNATPLQRSNSKIETTEVTSECSIVERSDSSQADPKGAIEKSKTHPDIWNILFRCLTCNIVSDDYDHSVEHSQKHFTNTESDDIVVKHCEICCLKFDGTSYERHQELHAQNPNFNKESFKIITYKHSQVFTPLWFTPIRTVLGIGKEKQEMLSKSIYLHTRRIKMRLVQDGDPESLMVKCCKCEIFINPATIHRHYKKKSCTKYSRGFICKFCKFRFDTPKAKFQHRLLHKKFDRFKIVFFNEEGDDTANETFARNYSTETEFDKTKNVRYYRCESCKKCYFAKWKETKLHTCKSTEGRRCEKCDLNFDHRFFPKHLKLHELNPHFNKDDNIKIIKFIPKSMSKTEEGFIVSDDPTDGKDVKKTGQKQSKDITNNNEQKPDPTNTVNVIPWSSRKIITRESLKKLNLKSFSNKLFKCRVCKAHLLRAKTLSFHIRSRHFDDLDECDICGYTFSGTTLERHRYVHHERMNLKREDFVIVVK